MIWVLADNRAGHATQALGVADALRLPYETKRLDYAWLAKLPNILLGATFRHLSASARGSLVPPWPELVIAAGRRTAPVARAIKRAAGGRCFIVQCMWPGTGASDFDLIAAPAHDGLPERSNLMTTVGAPHRVTPTVLAEAAAQWSPKLGGLTAPRLAVLVGGSTGTHGFETATANDLAKRVTTLARAIGGSIMMTTSRRTPPEASDALHAALEPAHQFDWTGSTEDNPYLGYLALADRVVVTGDSMTMCTEACASGKPVYIHAPSATTASKHQALHRALYDRGLALPLNDQSAAAEPPKTRPPPLDDAADVAAEIRRRLPDLAAPEFDGTE
jgi:hypothetical protein